MAITLTRDHFAPYIYGLHEAGGEHLMLGAGRPGWVLELAKVGHDPNGVPAGDYTPLTSSGLRVIVRLNHGYGTEGTIPRRELYEAFARSCTTFVARCRGCNIWIIGNEPNHEVERPDGELILPTDYAAAYRSCRKEIHRLDGHQNDQVLVAGPALWNATTTYPENPTGDWVKYFADILARLPTDECDGFAIHTYTHLHDPNRIKIDVPHPSPDYHHLRDEFRSYRDLMEAIPARLRSVPVYITETDPTERNRGWGDGYNLGWVRAAYEEIAAWNSNSAHQPIQAVILYRWFKASDQPEWSISDRPGIQEDFRGALSAGPEGTYRVRLPTQPPGPDPMPPVDDLPDIVVASGYTNQHLITAFRRAGTKLNLPTPWGLMAKAGLKLSTLAKNRDAVYTGPAIDTLPNLTIIEKRLVKWELVAIYKPPWVPKEVAAAESTATAPLGFLRICSDLADTPLAPPEDLQLRMNATLDSTEKRVISTWNLYGWLLVTLADKMSLEPALAVAVTAAEVGQRGFGSDGRMLIRFENHIFLEKWGRQDPGRYWEHFYFDPERPWSDHRWRATVDARWQPCHGRQADEWAAFELARTLDETAAKESTAMGAPRLMGFLHPEIGHQSVDQMYSDFAAGEGAQLVGFFDFLRGPSGHSRRLAALRQLDFCKFAALHNGPGQAAAYGAMIAHAFEAFQGLNPLG